MSDADGAAGTQNFAARAHTGLRLNKYALPGKRPPYINTSCTPLPPLLLFCGSLQGESLENLASNVDTYTYKQPLGVCAGGFRAALLVQVSTSAATPSRQQHQHLQPITNHPHCNCHLVPLHAGICPFNFPAMIPLWMFPMAAATGGLTAPPRRLRR